jgi:hypothetical protein
MNLEFIGYNDFFTILMVFIFFPFKDNNVS